MFSTRVEADNGVKVIYVSGEIDMETAARLRDAIEAHMGPAQTIILDFSDVAFIDSSCAAVLAQARTTLTEDGGSLVLRNPSYMARRVLGLVGLASLLEDYQ